MTMVKSLSDNSSILFILVLSSDVFSHSSCDFSVFCYGKWFSNVSWKFSLLFWILTCILIVIWKWNTFIYANDHWLLHVMLWKACSVCEPRLQFRKPPPEGGVAKWLLAGHTEARKGAVTPSAQGILIFV